MRGVAFTTTGRVVAGDVQPLTVTVTLYVPEAPVVAFRITGFCEELLNPPGPVHVNVPPVTLFADKFIDCPLQIGLFEFAVGAAGADGSLRETGPAGDDEQPDAVTVILL